jgi:hypothetical protein
MLRNHGESLVQQILQAKMICPDDEFLWPEVRTPMVDGLDQANQFPLIGGQLGMVWHDGAAEEHDGPCALMEYGLEARAGGITVNDEWPSEV